MPIAYFSKIMNSHELNYDMEEKECLAVLYAVDNFRPYLYGRGFILACDHEPIHWMTYADNPGTRLIKWRLKLKDYQYQFEYKKGKLNKGVEALSGNPVKDNEYSGYSSSNATESSSDSDEFQTPSSTCDFNNPVESVKESVLDENFSRVMVVHDRSAQYKALPVTPIDKRPSKNVKEPVINPERLTRLRKRQADEKLSHSVQQLTEKPVSILKQPKSQETVLTSREGLKASVPKKPAFKPLKSNPSYQRKSVEVRPTQRRRLMATTSSADPERSYLPPSGTRIPDPDMSGIGKRLSRRRNVISKTPMVDSDSSSTEDLPFSGSENSDPPVFRKAHSVLPGLEPIYTSKRETSLPKSAPANIPPPPLWLSPQDDPYVDVYIDGACSYNGSDRSKAGIGVWFGPNYPLNVSRPATGRQTNNAAEVEAAIEAARRAHEAGIKKLRINTDSKFVIDSATEWIPRWASNDWKTYENKPVKNREEFQKLILALEPLDVEWNHIPSHQGDEGNEEADRLAREGINKEPISSLSELQEDQTDNSTTLNPQLVVVNVPQSVMDTDDDELEDDQGHAESISTFKEDLQKSFSQFDKSITERRLNMSEGQSESMLWDHEGMDKNLQLTCTHVSKGEEDEELLKELKALDPCEEYDDSAFAERVQNFLQDYEKDTQGKMTEGIENTRSPELPDSPEVIKEKFETNPQSLVSPKQKNSGVARRSIVRFKDQIEEYDSPLNKNQITRKSWYPTPISTNLPDAMSTPFPSHSDKDNSIDEPEEHRGQLAMKP